MVRVRRPEREAGFTLLELLFAMMLFGIVVAIGVAPYRSYERAQGQLADTRRIVGILRNAQIRAVAEDATYRVTFTPSGTAYTLDRKTGATWATEATYRTSGKTSFSGAAFDQPDGTTAAACYFYPRGSATKGSVAVVRSDSGKTYTVNVEGLTARVSYA